MNKLVLVDCLIFWENKSLLFVRLFNYYASWKMDFMEFDFLDIMGRFLLSVVDFFVEII